MTAEKREKRKLQKLQLNDGLALTTTNVSALPTPSEWQLKNVVFISVEDPVEEVPVTVKVENPTEWWMQLCPEEELDDLRHSGKLMLLFSLLEECHAIGDKLLVFSQSLYTLDVIEVFLKKIDDYTQRKSSASEDDEDVKKQGELLGGYTGSWSMGLDYFRLDGSTNIENRNLACNFFNSDSNPTARFGSFNQFSGIFDKINILLCTDCS